MNTTTRFHLTAAAFGVLIASSAYAETNQVYSYTVQAHNAPMTVDVIMKDGKINGEFLRSPDLKDTDLIDNMI